jgi:hypothetical protein
MTAEVPQPADKPADPIFHWLSLRPRLLLVLAVLAALGPFLGKPLNFDDPLFLWTARQIQAHPANPYGFKVNWYGVESPMWDVTKNPPLSSYYLAMAAAILDWGEKALHFAFLLPAVAAILGTYRLACRFTNRPVFAACATLFTPVFLVSSTTLMCDTLMLAFWVWAVVLWVEGIEGGGSWRLACAGLLMALAALTKYFGACLVPLLIAYSLIHRRRLGGWAGFFLIPVAALAAYQWITAGLYGRGLLSDAGAYVSFIRDSSAYSGPVAGVTALAFTGGCLAVATFLSPLLWRKRAFAGLALRVHSLRRRCPDGGNAVEDLRRSSGQFQELARNPDHFLGRRRRERAGAGICRRLEPARRPVLPAGSLGFWNHSVRRLFQLDRQRTIHTADGARRRDPACPSIGAGRAGRRDDAGSGHVDLFWGGRGACTLGCAR